MESKTVNNSKSPSGTPITAQLPAFVPVRLAAVFTPPSGGTGVEGAYDDGAPPAPESESVGGDDLVTDDVPNGKATPRLFRFMSMPVVQDSTHSHIQLRQKFVVKNTLDSVDAGTAPVRHQVKPEVKPKTSAFAAPLSIPNVPSHPALIFQSRLGMPSHLANARFELVPSSHVIGNWLE
ncbi:uncharacterized protein LOC108024151 isoform X3 [Drosophila biarmipes]|uniref:uncharacterized protein LOC108024151 isoform X3 n=1 Tax=Drosophila biarmipes TaxID=125945 RepID=UPI0007E6360F|nr:uncharacterized protein LOC108024151 isoform X3 [Drosophila biarmipes]